MTDTETTLTANPIHVATGMRMMAKHLLANIDPATAHWTRLVQVCDEANALIDDARRLIGNDQHDGLLWATVTRYRDVAYFQKEADKPVPPIHPAEMCEPGSECDTCYPA